MNTNMMKAPANRKMSTRPLTVPRTNRRHTARGLTSLPAGKMVPIAAFPLLREDSVVSGRLRFNFESMETAEILMNAINVRVSAYLVPMLALDRFKGSMDVLNKAYEGVAPLPGVAVVPYITTTEHSGVTDIHKYLGLHARPSQPVNSMYVEAYNQIWNFRAANRSKDINPRTLTNISLAPAFWNHERFKHIVPDFDQAVIDGEVALNIANSQLSVGLKPGSGVSPGVATDIMRRSSPSGTNNISVGTDTLATEIVAELAADGITVSLSNIELARKTQAFAKLREQYHGHSDEWLINLLMDGISVPEQAFTQPILIGEKQTVFGMAKRYASDAGNLTESVVNGATFLDMSIQLPRIGTGGLIMVVAEITPDQLFERQKDPWFHAQDVDDLPHYLRDTLDPEKVSVVPNEYVDIDHTNPNGTFGYAPLNYQWNIEAPKIGGRFYRPDVDAGFDEDRQRIWAVETANPTLAADFYLCTNIHTKPFVVTNQDPFECVVQGDLIINGNTVFGGVLHEATNDYDKVMAQAPQDRIEKP